MFVDDATSQDVATAFQPGSYFPRLSTKVLGTVGLFSPSLPSTQEFVKTHSGLLPDGTVVVADIQTVGKGKLNRRSLGSLGGQKGMVMGSCLQASWQSIGSCLPAVLNSLGLEPLTSW